MEIDMTKPLSPEQVLRKSKENIPSIIFETINKLLIKKASPLSDTIIIKQHEILDIVLSGKNELKEDKIFEHKWLDIEPYYEEIGWNVEYHKPSYYETWRPYFSFKFKSK